MKPGSIAIVGAAETTELGKIPNRRHRLRRRMAH